MHLSGQQQTHRMCSGSLPSWLTFSDRKINSYITNYPLSPFVGPNLGCAAEQRGNTMFCELWQWPYACVTGVHASSVSVAHGPLRWLCSHFVAYTSHLAWQFHQKVCIFLHFSQFAFGCWPVATFYGACKYVPRHVWTIVDATSMAATKDGGGDDIDVCASIATHHTLWRINRKPFP